MKGKGEKDERVREKEKWRKGRERERKVERWVLKAENLKNIISTFNGIMTLFSFFVSE